MTRRSAIIAALLAPAAYPGERSTFLVLEIPESQPNYARRFHACPGETEIDRKAGLTCTDDPERIPYTTALEVRYKGRVVRLTGDEIMDALEGK